jgi:hypothetical protein
VVVDQLPTDVGDEQGIGLSWWTPVGGVVSPPVGGVPGELRHVQRLLVVIVVIVRFTCTNALDAVERDRSRLARCHILPHPLRRSGPEPIAVDRLEVALLESTLGAVLLCRKESPFRCRETDGLDLRPQQGKGADQIGSLEQAVVRRHNLANLDSREVSVEHGVDDVGQFLLPAVVVNDDTIPGGKELDVLTDEGAKSTRDDGDELVRVWVLPFGERPEW